MCFTSVNITPQWVEQTTIFTHTCIFYSAYNQRLLIFRDFFFSNIVHNDTFSAGTGCSTVLGFMLLRDSLLGWGMIGGPNLSFTDRWSCCWSSPPSDFSWKTHSKYTNKIKPQNLQSHKSTQPIWWRPTRFLSLFLCQNTLTNLLLKRGSVLL